MQSRDERLAVSGPNYCEPWKDARDELWTEVDVNFHSKIQGV